MANRGPEVELLREGTSADAPSKGTVVLNMLRRQNAWEVRKGFGQLAQVDTLAAGWMLTSAGAYDWRNGNGYRRVLGSAVIKTKKGNRQIVTVVASQNRTGAVVADTRSTVMPMFCVLIYDVDSGGRWEEPVYKHTSEEPEVAGFDITKRHGAYETTQSNSYAKFVQSPRNVEASEQVWFTEINDILYFGSAEIGLYAYLPVSLRKLRRRQLSTQYRGTGTGATVYGGLAIGHGTAPPYSECCFIKKVPAGSPDSNAAVAYDYLDETSYPKPAAGCRAGAALVLANGANIYITDGGFPGAIKAQNVFVLPTDESVRAMRELSGNLYVYTENETWLVQLSSGAVSTLGRTIKLSDGVGCSGPSAIVKTKNSITWLDSRGVYRVTGVAQFDRISDPIEPFFTGELSSPLNNYFTAAGHISATQPHVDNGWPTPRAFYRHSDDTVTAAYNEALDATMFSFPSLNAMVVYAEGQWAVWPLESMAYEVGESPQVGALNNIKRPMVMADEKDIFITCGVDSQFLDSHTVGGAQYDYYNNSISHLQYGRGGAVDRSIEDEDYRLGLGAYVYTAAASATSGPVTTQAQDGGWYFHEPIPIEPGRQFGGVTISTPSYWIPVELVKPSVDLTHVPAAGAPTVIEDFALLFTFDNTHWTPLSLGSNIVEAMFPPERADSIKGYGHWDGGTAGGGSAEFRVYPDITGNEVRIYYDGSQSPAGSTPNLNCPPFQRSRMFYIPMMRKAGANVARHTVGFGIQVTAAHLTDGRGTKVNLGSYVWAGGFMGAELNANNSVAQPVDWAYKSAQIGMNDDSQYKARGTYTRMLSHGSAAAANRVSPNWPTGVYNTVVASDFKGWVSQIIDVAPTQTDAAKAVGQVLNTETLRTRYLGSSALSTKVFSENDTGDHVHYGNKDGAGTLADVYLVDDEEVDVVAVSNSVKGGHITYMVWGMMRNKAERLVLESVKAVVRAVGGRRRDGH